MISVKANATTMIESSHRPWYAAFSAMVSAMPVIMLTMIWRSNFTTCLPDPATLAPWHQATGLGVCASCLSCLLVLISPFYEHHPYRTATTETRVLEDKTLIGAMVEIDANVEAFHVSTSSVGIAEPQRSQK